MPYQVIACDNFHYMDESERTTSRLFDTAEEAAAHCRWIVDDYLLTALKPGMTAEQLWDSYTSFGEDPFIVGVDAPQVKFSGWDYARERCQLLCATGTDDDSALPSDNGQE